MTDCIDYRLPQIPYLQLRFKLSAQTEAHLPRSKGSLLRGAFGHALRRMVCVMGPGELCENCMLRGQCIFSRLFETFIKGEPPPFLNVTHARNNGAWHSLYDGCSNRLIENPKPQFVENIWRIWNRVLNCDYRKPINHRSRFDTESSSLL
jgi:hypothetical protein